MSVATSRVARLRRDSSLSHSFFCWLRAVARITPTRAATTTAPGITFPTTDTFVVLQPNQALRLHKGQSKMVIGQDVLVICVSHGVTVSTRSPDATSGTTVGRDVFKRGPRGTASLTMSNANGSVTADCR
jgi:hypothetical protein